VNINLVCVAKNEGAQSQLESRFDGAVSFAQSIFGTANDHVWSDGRTMLFNADRMAGAWCPPTWFANDREVFSFSQPPIPVDVETSPDTYERDVTEIVRQQRMQDFLPNHFGIHRLADGTVRIWADSIGLGRVYFIENNDFLAASNHIGILGFFTDEPLELDEAAIARFVEFGWFTDDTSPYRQVRRLDPSTMIEADPMGNVRRHPYFDMSELVRQRDETPDYDAVVDQTRRIARNLNRLSVRTPNVYLSGGRDSRMTAGIWLSGGSSARVVTLGTLEEEAKIAEELMEVYYRGPFAAEGVEHTISHPTTSSIKMPISERLENCFAMWDGDAGPTNMKRDVRIPSGSAALSIGGVGGEIMHGYFYHREGDFDRIAKLAQPVDYVKRSFPGNVPTAEAHSALDGFFDRLYERATSFGRPDIQALDFYYLNEKFRRWGNQALGSMSAIMLSGPAYVRAAFDLTPEQKVAKVFPVEVLQRALPEWNDVRFYKANVADSRTSMTKKLSTWDTDPAFFYDGLANPRVWDRFIKREKVTEFLGLVESGDALPVHESWLNRALWVDHFAINLEHLNRKTSAVR
jgi:hypothetical protein